MTERIEVETCTDPDCPTRAPGMIHGHCAPIEVGPGLVTVSFVDAKPLEPRGHSGHTYTEERS
jgi:hypothetical protein